MSNLNVALKFMLPFEGGFSNDPVDPGGATNYGISLRYARTLHPEIDLDKDGDGDVDVDDMSLLSERDAMEIYTREIWLPYRYDELTNSDVAARVFDAAVNMGPKQAGRCIQRAVNCCYGEELLAVDGILGDESIKQINMLPSSILLPPFKADRWAVYRWVMEKSPALKKFRNGWTRRALA